MEKLTIQAQICLTCGANLSTAVSRGMSICSSDDEVVGEVAAVVVDGRSLQPTHLIITCPLPEYRRVPIRYISGVNEDTVTLNKTSQQLRALPLHNPTP